MNYNLLVVGAPGVGKTALIIQMCSNHFVENYDPTIEDTYRKRVVIDSEPGMLCLFDGFLGMQSHEIQGVILLYSVASQEAFNEVKQLYQEFKNKEIPLCYCLVGNKIDLEAEVISVTTEEGKSQADEWGIPFFETSAKTRKNVEEVFYQLVREIRIAMPQLHRKPQTRARK